MYIYTSKKTCIKSLYPLRSRGGEGGGDQGLRIEQIDNKRDYWGRVISLQY